MRRLIFIISLSLFFTFLYLGNSDAINEIGWMKSQVGQIKAGTLSDAAIMQDYCLVPPYVTKGAVPNIMIAYEKGVAGVMKRAYSTTYSSATTYYGFFDSTANYSFSFAKTAAKTANKKFSYFEKSACTPSATSLECISGNVLNWALMSSLDVSRKALVGFGWPNPGVGSSAGEVFTYSGNFNYPPDPTPLSVGQWDGDDEPTKLNVTLNIGGTDYTYSFCLYEATGSNPTGLKINVVTGIIPIASCPSNCNNEPTCIGDGSVTVKFADGEDRRGIIQKYVDKNQDYIYDSDAPRFGIRRYSTDKDKNLDILCDKAGSNSACSSTSGYCSSTDISPLFKDILTTISKAPPAETTTAPVADMMVWTTEYFRGDESKADKVDNDNYTQTAYCWASDPSRSCRKNFVIYVTTGVHSGSSVFSPGHPDCKFVSQGGTIIDESYFAQNVCYAFKTDLSNEPGMQNIQTYVVHTSFYGSGACTTYSDCPEGKAAWDDCISSRCSEKRALKYAVSFGEGEYFEADNPSKLQESLEKAILNILDRTASGTAASVLASGEGSGANLEQAVFYPVTPKIPYGLFDRRIKWIGKLSNFWYYVDPFFTNSNIREDTDQATQNNPLKLNLINDYIATMYYDSSADLTKAARCQDKDGDGDCDDPKTTVKIELLGDLWEAGKLLWNRNLTTSPRTIKTTTGSGLIDFSVTNKTTLRDYLQARSDEEAEAIIRYIHGEDNPKVGVTTYSYRSRKVAVDLNGDGDTLDTVGGISEGEKVWKLGDIINSTPKISSWIKLNSYDEVYGDTTYGNASTSPKSGYIYSANYTGRGMVFAGGNDGMLHAFKLGDLGIPNSSHTAGCTFGSNDKACLTGTDLGKEVWAFIPKNALPYLKYTADPDYCHLYIVDLSTYIFDASIGGNPDVNRPSDGSSWRTILIGGMRFGGACKPKNVNCATATPNGVCAPTEVSGKSIGFSSYFALDVTDQNNPTLLWEFSHENLGFTTSGPAVVRINAIDPVTSQPNKDLNGHWFVVFGSGPTGPTTGSPEYQFLGRSDQTLKIFVLDLKTGNLMSGYPYDTMISNAFAGSMLNSTHDPDLDYQDNVIYIPYVSIDTTTNTWTKGGVYRLITREDITPSNWDKSKVIDGVGPVTSAVVRLQNNKTNTLWLFFGTGRYYFKLSGAMDDPDNPRRLYGIKEPCFTAIKDNLTCSSTASASSDATNKADLNPDDVTDGWYINLDSASGGYKAERVITDPLSTTTSGLVFFTTFKPYTDLCASGKTLIWAVKYSTGGAPGALLKGKALVQVSTGSIEQVDLSAAFTEKEGRRTTALEGLPPTAQGLSILSTPPPVKKTIHMKER